MNKREESINTFFAGEYATLKKQSGIMILKFLQNQIHLFLMNFTFTLYITGYIFQRKFVWIITTAVKELHFK